jgi:hypothetical protein
MRVFLLPLNEEVPCDGQQTVAVERQRESGVEDA